MTEAELQHLEGRELGVTTRHDFVGKLVGFDDEPSPAGPVRVAVFETDSGAGRPKPGNGYRRVRLDRVVHVQATDT